MRVRIKNPVVVNGFGVQYPGAVLDVEDRDAAVLIGYGDAEKYEMQEPETRNRVITKEELKQRVKAKK